MVGGASGGGAAPAQGLTPQGQPGVVLPPGTRGGATRLPTWPERGGPAALPQQNRAPLPESGDMHRGRGHNNLHLNRTGRNEKCPGSARGQGRGVLTRCGRTRKLLFKRRRESILRASDSASRNFSWRNTHKPSKTSAKNVAC